MKSYFKFLLLKDKGCDTIAGIGNTYLKSFISGFVFVSIVTSLIVFFAQVTKNFELLVLEITLAAFIFGIWNVLYFVVKQHFPKLGIGVWGALLGLLFGVATILRPSIHIFHAQSILSIFNNTIDFESFNFFFHKLSLLWLPLLFFVVWYYIIRWLNNLWGCRC